jgi:hypothetical protein
MNLIPDSVKDTGSYYCTWDSQYDNMYFRNPDVTSIPARDMMNEEFLFGKNGVLRSFEGVRGDLIVVLDDGWDVSYGAKDMRMFGTLEVDPERFPSLRALHPADRLKALSDNIRQLGYKGLGLWIPTQTPSLVNGKETELSAEEERLYWEERGRWCAKAGVLYLKSDWGKHSTDPDYCLMMHASIRKYAPGIRIENGLVGRPLLETPENRELTELTKNYLPKILRSSDFLRTNDVVHELKYASTIDRAAICLEAASHIEGKCAVLNIEDTPAVGAALGCASGVMRHDFEKIRKWLPGKPRLISETACALRWQRIAPPFAANMGELHISEDRMKDIWHYPSRARHYWPSVAEGDYYVTAPALVSRNMPLPVVGAQTEKPYVLSSVHPDCGALCVAAVPRCFVGRRDETPIANISVKGAFANAPIGLFGRFGYLSVYFDESVEGRTVVAQNMLSNEAQDITGNVWLDGNCMVFSGDLMMKIGSPEDAETGIPAVAVKLI